MPESTLFVGGRVRTMVPRAPWAEAVVVRDGLIAYVGDAAGARELTGPSTEVVDLRGGALLPGFIDAHDHLCGTGAMMKVGVDLSGVTDPREAARRIGEHARANPDAPVVRGHGFTVTVFGPRGPRRELIDEVVPDRPVLISSYDAHDCWFNTAAMAAVGLDASTPDPDPGSQYFVRDADGTPTGHGVEGLPVLVLMAGLGLASLEGLHEAQRLTLDPAPSWGITSAFEAGIILGPNAAAEAAYLDLVERDRRGELPIRISGTVWTREATDDPHEVVATLADWNARIRSENVSIGTLKMWSDGTAASGGALLLEPFCGRDSLGSMTFPPEAIEAQVEAAHLAGFDMHIHVDADGSTRTVLDAIERVQRRHGRGERRHTICHVSFLHPQDLPRFAELGVIANVTPMWGTDYDGVHIDLYREILGEERARSRAYAYGDLVRSGATVTYGADIPGVRIEEIAPLTQIQAAVTRRRPGDPFDRAFVPEQRVSLDDALRAYTVSAAYQLRLEDEFGTIEVGKRADLVALGENLFALPDDEIHACPVSLTMLGGRVTHDAR